MVSDLALEGEALRLLDAAGEIDALVANAGLPASGRLDCFTPGRDRAGAAGQPRVAGADGARAGAALIERGEGHLVFLSSISGKAATARASLYAATKFGLRGFALCLRDDLRPHGVGVSVVSPGSIRDAGMFADSGAGMPMVGTGTPDAGRRCGGSRDRARPRRDHGRAAAPAAAVADRDQRSRALEPASRAGSPPRSPTRSPPGRPTSGERVLDWSHERLLLRQGHAGGLGPRVRDLPPRRPAGEVRRRAPAVLAQGPARERAAARGRRVGDRLRRRDDRLMGGRAPSPRRRSPTSRRGC